MPHFRSFCSLARFAPAETAERICDSPTLKQAQTARSKAAASVAGAWPKSFSSADRASGAGSPAAASSRRRRISGPSTRVSAA